MLDSLYTEAVRKKGLITDIFNELEDKDSIIFKMWNDEIIFKSNEDFPIAAGDGSFNKKKFLSFYFFAVAAESLIFDKTLKKLESVEINTLDYHRFSEDLLRNYMGLFEVKNALKVLNQFDLLYYLYDGSILGDLIRPFPTGTDLSKKLKSEVIENCLEELNSKINKLTVDISSDALIDRYYKIYPNKFEINIFLTNIEKLLVLKKLLKYNKKLIAISKTSTSNELFNSNIPDIAIFDKYTKSEGYSKPIYKDLSKEVKHVFEIEDEFFKSLKFTIFYLRLEENKNVLKVELPYIASEEDIIQIISRLKRYSTEGYPYLLKKAHKDVVISTKDIDHLGNIVNIYEKSGREMLD